MGLFSKGGKDASDRMKAADKKLQRIAEEELKAHRRRGGKGGAPETDRWHKANDDYWAARKAARRW